MSKQNHKQAVLTSQTVLISLIYDDPESSSLAAICAALMFQGGRGNAMDITDGESAAEESTWQRLAVRVDEGKREAPCWLDYGRRLLWGGKKHWEDKDLQ